MSEKQMKDFVSIVRHVGSRKTIVDARYLYEHALDAQEAGLLKLVSEDDSGKGTGFIVTEKGKALLKEEDK